MIVFNGKEVNEKDLERLDQAIKGVSGVSPLKDMTKSVNRQQLLFPVSDAQYSYIPIKAEVLRVY